MRRHFAQWPAAGALLACTLVALFLPPAAPAVAGWTPARSVSGEDGVLRDFGQAVAPDGTGTVVWSSPSAGDPGYPISARTVAGDGSLGAAFEISAADPGAALTTASAPAIAHSGNVATVVWLESSYDSDVCLNDPYAEPPEPGEECVVTQSLKSRQIGPGGALGSIEVLDQRQTAYPAEGPFGGSGAAFVSYGQPSLAPGPAGTMTVLWSESEFAAGCTSYGYAYEGDGEGCAADHSVRWIRISDAGAPVGSPQSLYSDHTEGGGSANSQVHLELAAADGTATVVLTARTDDGESGCWGGERTIQTRRIESNGSLSPLTEVDTGCGWTEPRLALGSAGAAVLVWAWAEPYAVNEIRYSRIPAAGVPSAPEPLLAPDPEMAIDAPAVAFAGSAATAVWGADGELQARSIPLAGEPGPVRTLAAAPSADRSLDGIDLALAPDGSGVVTWEAGKSSGSSFETGVKAIELAADGTPGTVRTLLSPNRWDHGPRVVVGSGGDFLAAWRLSTRPTDGIQVSRPGAGVPMANDSFASAEEVAGPLPRFAAGSNEGASKEPEEPDHAGEPGGASLWYSWTPSSSGPVVISTCSSDGLDTLLGVYTGDAVDDLSEVHSSDDAGSECAATDSGARFNAAAGTTYRIAVDGKGGSEGSFALKIAKRPSSLANDDFDEAREISSYLPASRSGSNFGASKEPEEPDHAGEAGGASLWFSWTPSSSGPVSISTCFSGSFDPVLAVYTGSSLADLEPVASGDDGSAHPECGADDGEVRFEAEAGTTYRIAVDGKGGSEGFFTVQLISLPTNDDFADAKVLDGFLSTFASGDSRLASKEPGEPQHAGAAGGASLWYSWTPSSGGEVAISTCSFGGIDPVLAVYTGSSFASLTAVASDDDSSPSCAGRDAELRLDAVAGTTYRIAVDSKGSTKGPISLSIQPLPGNDDFADATPITGSLPQTLFGSNSFAGKEPGEPPHGGDPGGASVWYSWTPSASGPVAVYTCSFGTFDPLLGVYAGASLEDLELVAGNDDSESGSCAAGDSEVRFEAEAGTTYRIAVDGKGGGAGYFELNLVGSPGNDDLDEAFVLPSELPTFDSGSNRVASRQVAEPEHDGDGGGASVWYSWTPAVSRLVEVTACGYGALDPLLDAYTGSGFGDLAQVAPAAPADDPECSGDGRVVSFTAVAGTTYLIAIDGRDGHEGDFDLTIRGRPGNDDFADASELPAALPVFRFADTRLAGKEPEEPAHGGDPGGASLWYSWQPTEDGLVTVGACGFGALDPLLGVYTGASLGDLTEVASAAGADSGKCFGEEADATFAVLAGTTYWIAVDGRDGSAGSFELNLRTAGPDNDDFADAIEIDQPRALVAGTTLGATVEFDEDHSWPPAENTVWYRWTAPQDGPVHLHTCTDSGAPMDIDVFTGSSLSSLSNVSPLLSGTSVACQFGPFGAVSSGGTPVVAFEANGGTTYRIAVDSYFQTSPVFERRPPGPFLLAFNAPADDLRAMAERVPAVGASLSRSNAGATGEAGEEEHAGASGGASVWFRWFAPADGPARIDTCGSAIDTLLSVRGPAGGGGSGEEEYSDTLPTPDGGGSSAGEEYSDDPPVPGDGSVVIASSDDSESCGPGSTQGSVDFDAHEGVDYLIALDGKDGEGGPVELTVAFSSPDTTAPETSAFIPSFLNALQLPFNAVLDEPESSLECALNEGPFEPCGVPGGPGFLSGKLAMPGEGGHVVEIREVDAAGNADPTPVRADVVVDMIPPQTTITEGVEGLTRLLPLYVVSSDEEHVSLECSLDGGSFSFCASPSFLPSNLVDGDHTFRVRARDRAGNVDPTPDARSFLLDRTNPVATIDAGPEGTVESSSVEFEFSADEEATFRCYLDGQDLGGCTSPLELTGVGDGDHVFAARPTDLAGNIGAPAEWEFRVETKPPNTTIIFGPPAFDPNDSAGVSFVSSESPSTFDCSLDDGEFTPCESPHQLNGLADGEHTLRVRAVDAAGKLDATPAELSWTVDTQPPNTTITAGPTGPIHDPALQFEFESSEPVGKFQCSVDGAVFRACAGIAHDHTVGTHEFAVRAFDRAGNVDPTPAKQEFEVANEDPVPALGLDRAEGPAPLEVAASVAGSDPDEDPLVYSLQWGDGTEESGELPHSPLGHTYAEPGVYLARLAVADGYGPPQATTEIVVAGPPEAWRADAGDDRTVSAGEAVEFSGANSRPPSDIDSYQWSFGDGGNASGKTLTHVFSSAGVYEVTLAIDGPGGSDTDTARIEVVPPDPTPVKVRVRDGGSPIEGATVLVTLAGGARVQARSGPDGVAELGALPDGSHKVFAYRNGFLPGVGDVDVVDGSGEGEIELEPGEPAEVTVDSRRLTLEEIEGLGIDPNDPENQHVIEFAAHIDVGGTTIRGYVNRSGLFGCEQVGSTTCGGRIGGYHVSFHSHWVGDKPLLTSFVIPARATFLKEFYEVEMTVHNLAAPEFVLRDGHALISVPGGMSLAPTASPQSAGVDVPDIAGGEKRSLRWILRGDVEGEYDVSVDYAATLEPFGQPLQVRGETVEPIKVWGASALELLVDVDEEARDGYPYTATIELENVADIPVYNATVELLREGRRGYIEQPRQQRRFAVRELAPGATLTAGPFILVPDSTGEVDLDDSFLRKVAGDTGLEVTIATHERQPAFEQTPEVEARWRNEQDLILDWEPVGGATEYEIYATPDRETDFPEEPLVPDHEFDQTKAMVSVDADEEPPLLAISSVIGGKQTMVHPLVTAIQADDEPYPSIRIEDTTVCGDPRATATIFAKDPDFPLTSWGYAVGGAQATPNQPIGSETELERTITATRPAGELADVEVAFTNSNPGDGVERRIDHLGQCDYVALGDSFSSGEGAIQGSEAYEDGAHPCHRAPKAYANLLAEREDLILQNFEACSGAVTKYLTERNDDKNVAPQIDAVDGPDLVTLSMGGNDLGFGDILISCLVSYAVQPTLFKTPCKVFWGPEVESRLPALRQELKEKLEEVRQSMAPRGRLILVGYPQIFPPEKTPFSLSPGCQALHPSDIAWMHDMVTRVNLELAATAINAGAEFVDPNFGGAFDDTHVCRISGDSDFHAIRFSLSSYQESFHPKVSGQAVLRKAVEAQINDPGRLELTVEEGESIAETILLESVRMFRARLLWPGSDIELGLESPSGVVYNRGGAPAAAMHELAPTSESYLIPDPEPGEWKITIKGLETDDGGEPVTLDLDQVPDVPVPPIALFAASQIGGEAPLAVQFDGSDSFDPEDQTLTYSWDFGDGSEGTGIKPTHTYKQVGEYVTELTVVDEDGESDAFESDPIVVKSASDPNPDPGPGGSAPGAAGGQASSPPARSPGVALFARLGQVKGGAALIRARCSGETACRGVAKLTVRMQAKRAAGRSARRATNVLIGNGSFDIAVGKEEVLRISLVAAGKQLLRKAGAAGLLVQLTGSGLEQHPVKLKPEAKGKKKRKRGSR